MPLLMAGSEAWVLIVVGMMGLLGTIATGLMALFGRGLSKSLDSLVQQQAKHNDLLSQWATRDAVAQVTNAAKTDVIIGKLDGIEEVVNSIADEQRTGPMTVLAGATERLASALEERICEACRAERKKSAFTKV